MSKNGNGMWTKYNVRWDFHTSLCASVPANPELIKAWLDARKPKAQPANGKSITEIHEEVLDSLANAPSREEEEEKNLLVFQSHGGGLVMGSRTIRAHIKDCARIISAERVGKIKGERSFAHRLINCTYLDPAVYWVPILHSDGTPFAGATGIREKPIHFWNGRSALKAFEFIEGARLDFCLWVLNGNIKQDDLETVFQYGGVHGYAGERGDGEGKYFFSMEQSEDLKASVATA